MWSYYRAARRVGFSVFKSFAFALFRDSPEEIPLHIGKLRELDELERIYRKENARRATKI